MQRISRNLSKKIIKKSYKQIAKKKSNKQRQGEHHNSWSHRSRSLKAKPPNIGWLRPKRTQIHSNMSHSRTWARWTKIFSMKTLIVRIWIRTTIHHCTITYLRRTKTRASKYPTQTRTHCKEATTNNNISRFLLRTISCSFHNFNSHPSWVAKGSICIHQYTSSLLEHSIMTTTTAPLLGFSKTQPSCIQCIHLKHQRTTSITLTTTDTRYSKSPQTISQHQARAQAKQVG